MTRSSEGGASTRRERAWTGAVVAALLLCSCHSPTSQTDPTDPDSFAAWAEHFGVPGASLAVIRDFEIAHVEHYGIQSRRTRAPVNDRTLFQAASLSKSVSAALVVRLAREGALSLDTEINDYLTSWTLPWSDVQAMAPVTPRRLLSHTAGTTVSGFRGYRYSEPLPTLAQVLDGVPPANSPPVVVDLVPGTRFRYSGGGYQVMEQAVRDITGVDYPALVQDRILGPIGMTHSTFEQPLPDSLRDVAADGYYASGAAVPGGHHIYVEIAAGGLWTTAADVARFLIDLQLATAGRADAILSRQEAELLLTEVKQNYGLGVHLPSRWGQPYFGHEGANDGFRGGMIAHLTRGVGLVLLTNSDRGNELFDAVVELVGRQESWPGFLG